MGKEINAILGAQTILIWISLNEHQWWFLSFTFIFQTFIYNDLLFSDVHVQWTVVLQHLFFRCSCTMSCYFTTFIFQMFMYNELLFSDVHVQWTVIVQHLFLCPQRNFGRHIVITLSVPSVPLSCPVHISYILWGRNSKFCVYIHLGMVECHVPFSGHCDLDLWPSF